MQFLGRVHLGMVNSLWQGRLLLFANANECEDSSLLLRLTASAIRFSLLIGYLSHTTIGYVQGMVYCWLPLSMNPPIVGENSAHSSHHNAIAWCKVGRIDTAWLRGTN